MASTSLGSTKQKEHTQRHSLSATPISSPPLLSPSPSPSVGWRALVFVTPPASFPRTQIRGRFPIPAPRARRASRALSARARARLVAGERRAGLLPLNTGPPRGDFFPLLLRGRLPPRPLWRAGAERSEGPPVLRLISSFVGKESLLDCSDGGLLSE